MSALINSLSKHHTGQNYSVNESSAVPEVSDLSVITRIDYNLRFTKQAVLVISEGNEQYSQLASQYLVSLSNTPQTNEAKQVNVAYLSASSKLNDLQIRCRLVEQLFVNSLFDPEQSLAVSVIQFAKQQSDAISIVIEHAHTLSLQVKYELCQLVSLAKKQNIIINVVLFGLIEAAQQLAVNSSLFKNKMALIDAETGQIINLSDAKVQPQRLKATLSKTKKIILAASLLIVCISCFWGYQLISDDINKAKTSIKASETATVLPFKSQHSSPTVDVNNLASQSLKPEPKLEASGHEISAAILAKPIKKSVTPTPADSSDIIRALTLPLKNNNSSASENVLVGTPEVSMQNIEAPSELAVTIVKKTNPANMDSHYYHNQAVVYEQGYVIQIAGFYDQRLWARLITNNETQELFTYQRTLNNKKFFVVTSKVYSTKDKAKQALALLPENLIKRKPWLKDISSVINEINTFKG